MDSNEEKKVDDGGGEPTSRGALRDETEVADPVRVDPPPPVRQPAAQDPPPPIRAEPAPEASRTDQIARLQSDQKSLAQEIAEREESRRKADAEYEALRAEARVMSDKLSKLIGQPVKRATSLAELTALARSQGRAVVTAFVPKGFQHRLDDHSLIDVPAGAHPAPAELADHWWFRVNGVAAIR